MINVWTYWEGPRPPYIELCLDTIRKQCYRDCLFHHITSDNLDRYIPSGTLHPNWHKIRELGVKSDCIRAAVLALYGGLYIDADTVMLRSPVGVIDEDAECSYMEWTNPPRRVIAGYIYCKPGSMVAKQWLANLNRSLADGKWGWTDLGERCLTPAVESEAHGRTQRLPLSTFLPIEIDREVGRFFTTEDWQPLVHEKTIAFGLNHSWFMGRRKNALYLTFDLMGDSNLLIHKLLFWANRLELRPNIAVCCPTYRRPGLLNKMIGSFVGQSYQQKTLTILNDDSSRLEKIAPSMTHRPCIIHNAPFRYKTLGEKRNALVNLVPEDTDAVAMWDDDDLYMPWALQALAAALHRADWARASQVLVRHTNGGNFHPVRSYWRSDREDKAFHPAWAYSLAAFKASGGYPKELSLGEDLGLAKRLRALKVSEADPLDYGFAPYAVFGPWDNEHFSYPHKTYEEWGDKLPPASGVISPESSLELRRELIFTTVLPRPFSGDWYEDKQH